jgi:hypothetical protein
MLQLPILHERAAQAVNLGGTAGTFSRPICGREFYFRERKFARRDQREDAWCGPLVCRHGG